MRWVPPAILALALLVILPAAVTGWIADDAFYSALPGILGADRITLWQAMAHSFHIWFFGNGRFYPGLILEKYLVFDLFTNLVAYKILLTAATLATLEMFRRCVQAYTTPAFAALCALTAASLFLIHGYQDALIAFNAMPQLVAMAMFGSFIAFRAALVKRNATTAAVAVMLYVLAALTYEDVYLLCVIYPLLARPLTGNWRAAVRASAPYVAVAGGLALLELGLHGWVRLPPGALYAVNVNPVLFLKTAFYQITAALPFAYWIADPLRSFTAFAIGAFIGFAVIGWVALRAVERAGPKQLPVGTGVLAAILPALPVAVLVKYQHELQLGIGYLPVFFQTFGVALLLASAAAAAVRSRGSGAKIAAAFLLGLLGAGAYASNVQLARAQEPARAARAAFESAVANGLLKEVPGGSIMTIPKAFDWIDYDDSGPDGISTRGLLYRFGNKRADLEAPGDLRARYGLSYSHAWRTWSLYTILPNVRIAKYPGPCNVGALANGDFTFGFRCWAQVATMPGRLDGFPQFRIESAGACLSPSIAGNPYAAIDVPGGAGAYLAQTFRYRGTPTRITLRVWGMVDPVTVRIGVVFPVGAGIGTERLLDTFVPPAIEQASGSCSGLQPLEKHYAFSGYSRGALIQLRLHATSSGSNGAIAAFDDAASSP
jgi:hypothetical protein